MRATELLRQAPTFPAEWDEPFEDGDAFYMDPMHFPYPLSPLTESTLGPAFEAGLSAAHREMQTPIREHQVRHRNYYRFERAVMAQPATGAEARQLAEAAEATAKSEIGRMLERWQDEHLPRITAHLKRLRDMDVRGATDPELAAMLNEVDAIHQDLWTIHFRIVFPMLVALQLFDEFYADLFGGSEADAHALLVGVLSESVTAGFGVSDLAGTARELGLAEIIRDTPPDTLEKVLQASTGGEAFLAKLRAYLEDYGLRQDLFEYATPTWQEDPSFALSNIRNYLLTERDARAAHEAMVQSADSAIATARERLGTYPMAVRNEFEAMLQFARQASFLHEEHNFHIDQRGLALLRLFYLRVGDRLAQEGWLDAPDDIFMLSIDDLRGIVTENATAEAVDANRALVQSRRGEMELARKLTPPPFIGPPPDGPLPTGNPMERAIGRFLADRPRKRTRQASSRAMPGPGVSQQDPPALPAPWKRRRVCYRAKFS